MLAIALGLATIARSHGHRLTDDEVRQAFAQGTLADARALDAFLNERGLLVRRGRADAKTLRARPHLLPAVVATRDGGALLLLNLDAARGVFNVVDPLSPAARRLTLPLDEFDTRCHGELVSAKPSTGQPTRDAPFGWAWIAQELKRSRGALAAAGALAGVVHALALIPVVYMQVALDKALGQHATATLMVMTVGALCFLTLSGFAAWARDRLVTVALRRLDARLSIDLFDKLADTPPWSGRAAIVRDGVKAAAHLRAHLGRVAQSALDAVGIALFLAALYAYGPWMGVIATLGLSVALVVAWWLKRREIAATSEVGRLEAARTLTLTETADQLDTVKALGVEDRQRRGWRFADGAHMLARDIRDSASAAGQGAQTAMTQILTVLTVFTGVELVFAELLSPGAIVASSMLVGRIAGPLARLAAVLAEGPARAAAMARIEVAWASPAETAVARPRRHIRGGFKLVGVSLAFPGGRRALDGVDVVIPPGAVVGVTGPSGAGKSALMGLLANLRHPSEGRVLVDDMPMRHLDPSFTRRQIGWLPAVPAFFEGTILDNLRRAGPTTPRAEIDRAIDLVGLRGVIDDLDDGLETMLAREPGEDGVPLSLSIRQRLALARALIADTRALIIDEGLDALDPVSLADLRQRLGQWAGGRTVVIATQEPGWLAACQRIVLLERGRVVADGPHAPLLTHSPHYQRLWRAAQTPFAAQAPSAAQAPTAATAPVGEA